jgi:acyl-CoA thioester hydrolase
MSDYPVTIEFPLHWGEMDALGHVNNARFFTWFESARIAFASRIGLLATREEGPILATTTCDFLAPIVYPATVVVGVRVTKVGTTSIAMEYAAWLAGAPQKLHARGSSVLVFVRYATGEKLPIPDAMRDAIGALHAAASESDAASS